MRKFNARVKLRARVAVLRKLAAGKQMAPGSQSGGLSEADMGREQREAPGALCQESADAGRSSTVSMRC